MSNKKIIDPLLTFFSEEFMLITSKDGHLSLKSFELYFDYPVLVSHRLFYLFDTNIKGYLTQDDYTNGLYNLFEGDTYSKINFFFEFFNYNKEGIIYTQDILQVLNYFQSYSTQSNHRHIRLTHLIKSLTSIDSLDIMKLYTYLKDIDGSCFIIFYSFFHLKKTFNEDIIELLTHNNYKMKEYDMMYFNSVLSPSFICPLQRKEMIEYIAMTYNQDIIDHINKNMLGNNNDDDDDFDDLNSFEKDIKEIKNNNFPLIIHSPLRKRFDKPKSKISEFLCDKSTQICSLISIPSTFLISYDDHYDAYFPLSRHKQLISIKYLYNFLVLFKYKEGILVYDRLIPLKNLYVTNEEAEGNQLRLLSPFLKGDMTIAFNDSTVKENFIAFINKVTNNRDLFNKYSIKETLSNGHLGLVQIGVDKRTNCKVILKTLNKKSFSNYNWEVEISRYIMKNPHKNIIQCYDIFDNHDKVVIVYEYIESGSLKSLMKHIKKPIDSMFFLEIIKQIFNGVEYLHKHGIIHRDLKLNNILYYKPTNNHDDIIIKVIDFGLSKMLMSKQLCDSFVGTPMFIAPEMLCERSYSFNVDIWSLGIIVYYLQFGMFPFGIHEDDTINIILHCIKENKLSFEYQCKYSLLTTLDTKIFNMINGILSRALQKSFAKRTNCTLLNIEIHSV